MDITLRKATLSDSHQILSWRNEPTTIPWMGATRELSFEEHQAWLVRVLNDSQCLFLIIEYHSEAIGQIRYHINHDIIENAAKVSINITERMHGKGIASIAFRKGSELVRALCFSNTIFAYVQPDNIASIRAMEKAGFVRDKTVALHNISHLIMLDCEKN